MSVPKNSILLGKCEELLREIPSNSIDSVVTDPPYGLGNHEPTQEEIEEFLSGGRLDTGGDFMGNKWEIPSVFVWKECFRVLKPGGLLLTFAGSRTLDLFFAALQRTEFETEGTPATPFGQMLQWCYGSGMPKNFNVQEALTQAGASPSDLAQWRGWGTALKPSWEPILSFRKPSPQASSLPSANSSFFFMSKASQKEKEEDLEDVYEAERKNPHPTVKPLWLMKHLIRLSTPPGGLVLDPYCGSGTTCLAALSEGCSFLGMDIDPTYVKVAMGRIAPLLHDQEIRNLMENLQEE